MTKDEAKGRIEKILAYMESLDADEEEVKDIDALNTAINALDERKIGKWVDDGQYAEGHSEHGFHCSLRGGHIVDYECQVYAENPRCKWCGAKMEGADE